MKTRTYEKKDENFVPDVTMSEEVETSVKATRPEKYIITVTNLALRVGPGKDFEKIGLAEAGQTLIERVENGYGKLADGSGWVSMDYVRKVD